MSAATLETFIKKYQTAKNYNSKEIRLTIQEAEMLSTALAQMLASTSQYQSQIIELQQIIEIIRGFLFSSFCKNIKNYLQDKLILS